jgi:predicted TIM-barrel fold metal-dependent hydrolase
MTVTQRHALDKRQTRGRIDVHHHYVSRAYVNSIGADAIAAQGSSRSAPDWTPEHSLKIMEHAGIETAILSLGAPGVDMGGESATVRLARESNEDQVRIMAAHPGRFGFFAALPLPYFEAARREVSIALDDMNADGVTILTNYGGRYFGDPVFWPLLEELDARSALAFMHPTSPWQFEGFRELSPSTLEFPFDTTRALACALYHGIPERFPNIRFLWSHAGGAMPYMAGRTAVLSERNPGFLLSGQEKMLSALHSFYFDITQSASRATLAALQEIVPIENILFGTDWPMAGIPQVDLTLKQLDEAPLAASDRDAIFRGNALRLIQRLS